MRGYAQGLRMRPKEHEPGASRQTPPPEVARRLREAGFDAEFLLFCVPTDIDRLGRYRREWLVVSGERLAVLAEDGGPLLVEFELSRATSFRINAGVGSGLLQATVDGVPVDL